MLKDMVVKNRSYRRFQQEVSIGIDTLKELVELARLSASGGNKQPLKYLLSCSVEKNALVFSCLTWAAYLKDWDGPGEGERPSAYIILLGDTEISKAFAYDCGIAAQSILLGAVEKGLGGCILASVDRDKLRSLLGIADRYEIPLVIALGKPKEKAVIETIGPDADIKYWRDEEGVHHVPKRAMADIIM